MTDRGEVYLVQGAKGEYSDYSDWVIAAFTEKDRAELFTDLVQQKYNSAREAYKRAEEESWAVGTPYPDEDTYAFEEDPDAPIGSSYEARYTMCSVKLNPKF